MKIYPYLFMCCMAFVCMPAINGQDLMEILEEEEEIQAEYAVNTFFSTRVIAGQSVENPYPGNLIFVISHHFGQLSLDFDEFFGFDYATTRIGIDYGVNDRLAFSIGRSGYEHTFDVFFKYKLFRQQSGLKEVPLTLSWFSGAYIKGQKWEEEEEEYDFKHRMSYVHQLLLARQFSRQFSLQFTPAWVRKTQVKEAIDPSNYFILGLGGRLRITDWIAISAEYFYRLNEPETYDSYNAFSVGFDLDTGGHVFQLHFTNSQPMFEPGFLTDTRGSWFDGDIYFGFHITRTFSF